MRKGIILFTVAICFFMAGVAWTQTRIIPDTGDPNERFCNPKSYTDLGIGIVRDNVTGLEWVQDGNLIASRNPEFDNDGTAGDGMVTWQHALDYIELLNDDEYLGYDDWRLPTIEELSTLLDAGRSSPSIDPIFTGTVASYWSSTARASDSGKAWCVTFANISRVHDLNKTSYVSVRAVRGDAYGGAGNFVVNGDGTVTDTSTGLVWNQCQYGQTWDGSTCTGVASTCSWPQALQYVQGLNNSSYLGYSDWRLPTRSELQTLVDYSRHNPATVFPSMGSTSHISSTAVPDYKWYVSFRHGSVNSTELILWGNARAVRGGPCWLEEAECRKDDDCPEGEICSVEVGTCTNCVSDAECAPGEFCSPDSLLCVECSTDEDCAGGGVCSDGQCILVSCERDSDCVSNYKCFEDLCRPASCLYDAVCGDGWYCFSNRCIPDWAYCVELWNSCFYYEACINWQCVSLDVPPEIVAGPFVAQGPEPWPELSGLSSNPTLLTENVTILWEFDDDFGACEEPCTHSVQYQVLGAENWSGLEVYTDEAEPFVYPHYAWVALPVAALQHGTTYAFRFSVIDCMDQRAESEIYYFQPWLPPCDDDTDCDDDGVFCNGPEICSDGICISADDPCTDNATHPFCDEANSRCVECLEDNHCSGGYCVGYQCVECRSSADCDDDENWCDGHWGCNSIGVCVFSEPQCASPTVCDEVDDECVECLEDWHCPEGYCWSKECVECRNNTHCSDVLYCNGEEICNDGVCVDGLPPCGAVGHCDEDNDRCTECLQDEHCPLGYRCNDDGVCFAGGTVRVDRANVKAGKIRGADRILFSGTLNATDADLLDAVGGTITVILDAQYVPDLSKTTFTFEVPAASVAKGKYKSPKDPVVRLLIDTLKRTMRFAAKNVDLTGIGCPITVSIQFGDYAAITQMGPGIVNGKKPCPLPLMMGVKDSLDVVRVRAKKGKTFGTDSIAITGTFTIDGKIEPVQDVVITLGDDTFTIPGVEFDEKNGSYRCKNVESGAGLVTAIFDTVRCRFSIRIRNADLSGSGNVAFGLNVFGNPLQASGPITLPPEF